MKALAAALLLAGCSQAPAAQDSRPVGRVELVSLDCDTDKNLGIVKGVIRNVGQVPVEYATAYLRIDGETVASPVITSIMPPGAMGQLLHSYGSLTPPNPCALVGVQDQQGRSLFTP